MSFNMTKAVADGIKLSTASDNETDGDGKERTTTLRDSFTPKNSASRFVEELRPGEVRWFYKQALQDKTWQPLNGHDSLLLEHAYRKHAVSEKISKDEKTVEEHSRLLDSPSPQDLIEDPFQKVVVFGGLYRLIYGCAETPESPSKPVVSISGDSTSKPTTATAVVDGERNPKEKCSYRLRPIYWEGSDMHLTRGTWFYEAKAGDWQPLDADSAEFVEKIESKHLNVFANQRIPDRPLYFDKGPRPVLCEVLDAEEEKSAGCGARARWHSVADVILINNSRSSRLWRYLKLTGAGTKLRRGYHTEASMDDGPAPVTRLLFVIHGIGQKRQRNKIVTNATSMRGIAEQLLLKNYPNLGGRAMFLPVDWRAELHLDEGVISSITPNYVEQVRGFFNETILDLLYYASPIYGPEVLRGMCTVLNRMYRLYLSNDPDFENRGGKVSLIAHSLGSVITYDILTGGGDGRNFPASGINNRISIMPNKDSAKLIFPVEHLFCFGSPLGVFLAARHLRGLRIIQNQDDDPARGEGRSENQFKLHNIYHPSDPVAYRIEPLISEIYSRVRPLRIHRYNATDHESYEAIEPEILEVKTITTERSRPSSIERLKEKPKFTASDSDENLSGFESDGGPSVSLALQKRELPASSPSPPPKRSWSAAVFSRLGMGNKENIAFRDTSPTVTMVVDGNGEKRSESPDRGLIMTRVVEQAKEATEAQLISQPQPQDQRDGNDENVASSTGEKKAKDTLDIPPGEALPYRVDYTLREGFLEYASVYWLISHISYWSNHDAVQYILSRLYGPPGSNNANGSGV